jgi:hypothetical protein
MAARFAKACARLGMNADRADLDKTQFRAPPRAGDQMSLI